MCAIFRAAPLHPCRLSLSLLGLTSRCLVFCHRWYLLGGTTRTGPCTISFSETAGVKLDEQIPELPAPPSTSPLTAHRRLMQQKEQKQQQLDARKLQNIIKSRLLGPGSGGPTLLPPGASAAQGAVDRGGAEQLQQAGSAMAKFVRARVEAGAGGMAAMLGRKE